MSAVVIEHEGKKYVALWASSSWEDSEAEVVTIEVTPAVIAQWRDKLLLVDQLKAMHDIEYAAWYDCSPEWRQANWEEDAIDADGDVQPPVWEAPCLRTETDRIEVMPQGIEFTAFAKHTDERLRAFLDRNDIPGIEAALEAIDAPRKDTTPCVS